MQERAAAALHELIRSGTTNIPQDKSNLMKEAQSNHESLHVKTRRMNDAGTITTMIHPNAISRYAVDIYDA